MSNTPNKSISTSPTRPESAPQKTLKGAAVTVDDARATLAAEGGAASLADRFEVKGPIAAGGMGSVFAAVDRGLGRVVAIKRLREELEDDPGLRRRFVFEAHIGAQLEHPNILPMYSFERTESGAPAFAMLLVEGITLTEYIKLAADGPKANRRVGGIHAQKDRIGTLLNVCDAVHFAHSRGVVHRDLKPDNVMLGRYREVYVMDWGIARLFGQPAAQEALNILDTHPRIDAGRSAVTPNTIASLALAPTFLPEAGGAAENLRVKAAAADHAKSANAKAVTAKTGKAKDDAPVPAFELALPSSPAPKTPLATMEGDIVGTPQYMAPEQANGRLDDLCPATDQFALGVILLELTTLKRARSSDAIPALLDALQGITGERIDVDGDPVPAPLDAILNRVLQKNPTDRYPSVEAFADDLRRYIRGEPVSEYDEGRAIRLVRLAARKPVASVGVVGGLLLGAALAFIVTLTGRATEVTRLTSNLEGSRRVLVAVEERAHELDVRLGEIGAGVHAIRAATVMSHELGAIAVDPKELARTSALGSPLGSFTVPSVSWVRMNEGAPAPESAVKLALIAPWLRETLTASLPAAFVGTPEDRARAVLRHEAQLARCFVGLEDGSFVQVPSTTLPEDFDPRRRSWYRRGVFDPDLHWSQPIADYSRTKLRIQAIVGIRSNGALLGVAGCDLLSTALTERLTLDLPGFRRLSRDGSGPHCREQRSRGTHPLHHDRPRRRPRAPRIGRQAARRAPAQGRDGRLLRSTKQHARRLREAALAALDVRRGVRRRALPAATLTPPRRVSLLRRSPRE